MSLKDWLDGLQQESWQLELIISGVVIFLMLGAYEPIEDWRVFIKRNVLTGGNVFLILAGLYFVFQIAYFALLITFFLHLVLRGFWIGAIGLRSVSGDFDYEVLNFQPRFNNWLKGQLGSFDDYIERLETQCSVAFSFAFLLFFAVVSVGLFTLTVIGVTVALSTLLGIKGPNTEGWKIGIVSFINLIIVLCGLFYLIDFTSLGWFKKRAWLQRIYFPFYRLMGWLTLARFYRPFYYNMIDHPFGRKLVKRLWLIIFGAMLALSITFVRNGYYPISITPQNTVIGDVYLDNIAPGEIAFGYPSLASRYAEKDYLEVFMPYLGVEDDPVLARLFPVLAPALTGSFAIDGPVNLWSARNYAANNDSLLLAQQAMHRVYLNDSLLVDVPWRFYEHPLREQQGLLYDLPVYDLPRGRYNLRFERYRISDADSLYWKTWADIHFLR